MRAIAQFVYAFVVGDDWRVAVGSVATIACVGVLVGFGVNAWWAAPIGAVATLAWTTSAGPEPRAEAPDSR